MLYSNFLTLNLLKISELYFCHVLNKKIINGKKETLKIQRLLLFFNLPQK